MTTNSPVRFSELQSFLSALGFSASRADAAWVFNHRTEGLLVFRLYREDEPVAAQDLRSTRKFLDLRGLLEAEEFDTFIQRASTPA